MKAPVNYCDNLQEATIQHEDFILKTIVVVCQTSIPLYNKHGS